MSTTVEENISKKYNWDVITYLTGSVAFGIYLSLSNFRSDALKVARYVVNHLGYPVQLVLLRPHHVFTAFLSAIMKYTSIINLYKIKDHMLDLYGKKTQPGFDLSDSSINQTFRGITKISLQYGQESIIRSSLNIDIHDCIIDVKLGQQDYNLREYITASHINLPIQIITIYHQPTRYMSPYFNPLVYPGFNMANIMTLFGGAFATNVRFMLMPLFLTTLLTQAIKLDLTIRKSYFGFLLIKDKVRIYPTPLRDTNLRVDYILKEDKYKNSILLDTVNNISNFPIYLEIPYYLINIPGKNWIYRYTLATCKGILGTIRSKFGGIPYTLGLVILDGDTLRSLSLTEKDKLIELLKLILLLSSPYSLMNKKKLMSLNLTNILQRIPSPIIIR